MRSAGRGHEVATCQDRGNVVYSSHTNSNALILARGETLESHE
jgi:hypothetical protein